MGTQVCGTLESWCFRKVMGSVVVMVVVGVCALFPKLGEG